MFDFYLTIIPCVIKSKKANFLAKFNNLVYADNKLSSDEKLYLFGEMQKKWQKANEEDKK